MDTNSITRNYLDSLLFEQRLVDSTLPDIHVNIFGETFDTPVMTPAFSHLKAFADDRESAMIEYDKAAAKVGALNWFGMEPDDIAAEILDANPRSVRVIKPFADQDRIIGEMEFAADHGALAVGIDIDHVYGYDGQYDVVDDIKMGPISTDDLRKFVTATKLPLIIKGVLSVRDAVKCAAAGVKGIVVSHHHGRLPFAVPPLNVLPAIAHEFLLKRKRPCRSITPLHGRSYFVRLR